MKKVKILSMILVSVLLVMMLAACGDSVEKIKDIAQDAADAVKGFKTGDWEGNVYSNEKFGLKVSLPEEWYVFNAEELAGVFGDVSEIMKDSDIEIDEGLLVPLFFVMDNSDASLSTSNMNLTATRSLLSPNLDAEYTDETLEQMSAPMKQYGEVDIKKVGETDFAGTKAFLITMNTAVTGTEIVQYQRVYQVYKSGYLLTFTLTALDEAALGSLEGNISFE